MSRTTALLCTALLALPAAARAQSLKSEDDKVIYTLGTLLGEQMKSLALSKGEVETLKKGLEDAVQGKKLAVDQSEYGPRIQAFQQKRRAAAGEKIKLDGKAFAAKAAKEPGAQVLPSGVVVKTLKPGSGPQPSGPGEKVKVQYEGKLIDGTVFDSSYKRNEPSEFALNGVIKCWTEGVQKMHVGETAQLVCPSDVAYGDRGNPGIPPGSTLVFKVELLGIQK